MFTLAMIVSYHAELIRDVGRRTGYKNKREGQKGS